MRQATRDAVDSWWRDVFGVREELWSAVTVLHPHRSLGDYEGWYVAWREAGVHVSAPPTAAADEVAALAESPGAELMAPEFWQAFAHQTSRGSWPSPPTAAVRCSGSWPVRLAP